MLRLELETERLGDTKMLKFILTIAAVLLLSTGMAFAAPEDSDESDGERDPLEDVTCS